MLHAGDPIYSVDASGARVVTAIARITSVALRSEHALLELVLSDGRTLRASPGHPDATGRELAALRPGDPIDGATVVALRTVRYEGDATWDLLPASSSRAYFADGVLLGSTLTPE